MKTQKAKGAQFVIIKATEGTSSKDSSFSPNYGGATSAGLIRGGYHFAHPDSSSGAAQANFFLKNGGGWTNDGITLPGMVDMEYNPNGATCYGLSHSAMVSWIKDFGDTYKAHTGRHPMIYTTLDWWTQCTGNSAAFGDYPLVQAHYSSSIGTPPASWSYASFWQFSDSQNPYPGDQDRWQGTLANLKKFAKGG
ncbi:glycoside hydrolase family 25 protein [Tilletiaria anomala UBC 951]|uniref:N,O-diacetylmuramidase n=1 Tax=Tilletiaria anomala (strain ATCC 24038 / CBS 436.72 / UBC 951) TaxID=1037660 RepID=A0A066V371_TILAU|nr:glycoside hydrolase family 25 protein [Tilletiaria anomala UBC 951]KDN36167.1 glycoside hydrolase family 25 protein [Tilletiaria anomala UBC 951]